MHPGQFPLARFAPVALLACLLGIYFPAGYFLALGILLVATFSLLFLKPAYHFPVARFVVWMLLGGSAIFLYTTQSWRGINPELPDTQKGDFVLTIHEIKQQDSSRFRCWAQWQENLGVEVFINQPDSHLLQALPGDQLFVRTKLQRVEEPKNPGQFNYARYLAFHKVYYQAFVRKSGHYYCIANPRLSLSRVSFRIRKFLRKAYQDFGFDTETLGVAAALVFGDKSMLDDEIKGAYSAAGATHVLAVSGLHVGIVYLIILLLLRRKNGGTFFWYHVLVLIIALWFYALITGLSPSVQRAATMFSFMAVAKGFKRQSQIFNLLGASIVFLIIMNPLIVTEVGFQMSYLAVIGIVALFPWLSSLWVPKYKLLDGLWQITCVSMAAQLATGVLSFLYFRQFPSYFLVSNLFVIPLATVIVWIGAFTNLSLLFSTFVAKWLATGLHGVIWLLNTGVKWVETWPGSAFTAAHLTFLDATLFYLLLLGFMFWVHHRKRFLVLLMQGILIFWLCVPRQFQALPSFVSFSASRQDLWLVQEKDVYALYSSGMDEEQIDFTAGRYLASLGLFYPEKSSFNTWNFVLLGNDTLRYLKGSNRLWIQLNSDDQMPLLSSFDGKIGLRVVNPLWDVGCLLELNPEIILVSNTLGAGYVQWLRNHGISNAQLYFPRVDGPFIEY